MPKTKMPDIWDAGKALSHPLRISLYEAIFAATTAIPDKLADAHEEGEHRPRRGRKGVPGCPLCFPRTSGGAHTTLSPNELSKHLSEKLTNVSYHVRMLHDLGVIREVDREPRRGALEHYYAATCDIVIGVEPVQHNGKGPA